MELFVLYLWLKLEAVRVLFIIPAIVLLIYFIGRCIYCADGDSYAEDAERWKVWKPKQKWFIAFFVSFVLSATLLPSKTDVAILVGTHYALKATETPEAAKVMTLLRKKANDMLDEQLNEPVKEKK